MNAKLNRIAASTAAALALAFTGAAMAGDGVVKKTTTTTTVTNEAKLGALNGAIVRDSTGQPVGTIQSYSSADGTVTATVVNPAGVSSSLPLGSTETIITEIPASGGVAITLGADGSVQRPFTSTTTETTTTKSPLTGRSKSTTSTTTQEYK